HSRMSRDYQGQRLAPIGCVRSASGGGAATGCAGGALVKFRSLSLKRTGRSSTISTVLPRASTASGPRVASTPISPAAPPAAAPLPAPAPILPAALPAIPPTDAPTPAASPTLRASPALLPSPLSLPSDLSSSPVFCPSTPPRRARKSRVTPFGSVRES